jgi:transcriptional regulator GlxA family with amidase domain
MKKKNKVLAREIADAITYKEKYLESLKQDTVSGARQEPAKYLSEDPDVMLFNQIQDLVAGEKLFLDPNLDRQMLVDRLGVSKERIGAAFAKGSPYKSLIEYLNDCRLPYAAKLLTERPDLSVTDVAHESGFANADTLGRNFKVKYALTPTEYREQQ